MRLLLFSLLALVGITSNSQLIASDSSAAERALEKCLNDAKTGTERAQCEERYVVSSPGDKTEPSAHQPGLKKKKLIQK